MGGVAEFIKENLDDFADSIGDAIRAPFKPKYKTYTDITVGNLLEAGDADNTARRNAKHQAYGDAKRYSLNYMAFKRQYRKKYSKQFLENLGYNPSSTAVTRVIVPSKVQTYLQSIFGYSTVDVVTAKDEYLTDAQRCLISRQSTAGYDPVTGDLIVSGDTYNFVECTHPSSTQVDLTFIWDYQENIINNLTTNYSYDAINNTVLIADRLYTVGSIINAVNGSNQYETVCTNISEEYVSSSISASSTDGVTPLPATISYPDDSNSDGLVLIRELTTPGEVQLHIILDPGASVGDTLNIDVDGTVTSVTITQAMIDNGYDTTITTYTTAYTALLPDEVIYTDVVYLYRTYTNSLFSQECSYIVYRCLSGEIDDALRYYIASADTLPIYDYATVDITAIVTMKEDGNIVDTSSHTLNQMLDRLNLSGDQLRTSLENPDMDSAYLLSGVDPTINNLYHNKLLFQMFDLMATGNGNVTIAIDKLNMRYSFTVAKSTISGTIGSVGTYDRPVNGRDITLRYQGSDTEYQQITITGFEQYYTISGYTNTAYLDDPDGNCRLAIPLSLFNSLRYKEWVEIYENSLCMLGFAVQTVKIEWYQQGWFADILKIVGIIVFVFTAWTGVGAGIGAFIYNLAVNVAISFVIMFVASTIATAMGGTAGAIVGAVVAVYLSIRFGVYGDSAGSSSVWLKEASTAVGVLNQSMHHELSEEMRKLQEDSAAYAKEMEEKYGALKDKMDELPDGTIYSNPSLDVPGAPSPIFQTTSQYVGSIVNTEWLVDGNWMYNIERQINLRNQVYVGN